RGRSCRSASCRTARAREPAPAGEGRRGAPAARSRARPARTAGALAPTIGETSPFLPFCCREHRSAFPILSATEQSLVWSAAVLSSPELQTKPDETGRSGGRGVEKGRIPEIGEAREDTSMAIGKTAREFAGLPVVEYHPAAGLVLPTMPRREFRSGDG